MVTFVGKWWTEERKPDVEEVAKHIGALAWMGLRHLPKRPTLEALPGWSARGPRAEFFS